MPIAFAGLAMVGRIVRVLMGFALASLAAAATLVVFVYAPSDLASLRSDLNGARLSEAGFFALVITPHVAVSAALPALAGVLIAETRKFATWGFYAFAGIAIALVGFLFQHLTEAPHRESIFQAYALMAFLTAGLIGGLVYWGTSGRFAGS
jgi:hypothetical protein